MRLDGEHRVFVVSSGHAHDPILAMSKAISVPDVHWVSGLSLASTRSNVLHRYVAWRLCLFRQHGGLWDTRLCITSISLWRWEGQRFP